MGDWKLVNLLELHRNQTLRGGPEGAVLDVSIDLKEMKSDDSNHKFNYHSPMLTLKHTCRASGRNALERLQLGVLLQIAEFLRF